MKADLPMSLSGVTCAPHRPLRCVCVARAGAAVRFRSRAPAGRRPRRCQTSRRCRGVRGTRARSAACASRGRSLRSPSHFTNPPITRAHLPRREADAVDDGLDALAARDLHDLRRDVDRRVVLVPARARRRVVARRQSAFGVPAARARNEAPSPSRATLGSICIRFSFSRARGASKFN